MPYLVRADFTDVTLVSEDTLRWLYWWDSVDGDVRGADGGSGYGCWQGCATWWPNLQLRQLAQGWAGIPVSRDSREYKPKISLPFPWHFVISLPFPGKRKFWPGIKTGNTIFIFSFANGWSRHEKKSNLEFNLAFYVIPGISRDSSNFPFPSRFIL